eukprot:UC1_evm1s277
MANRSETSEDTNSGTNSGSDKHDSDICHPVPESAAGEDPPLIDEQGYTWWDKQLIASSSSSSSSSSSIFPSSNDSAWPAPRETLPSAHVDTDVAVIGGGVAGLSVAISLAERGKSVLVLEAEQIGADASARGAGIVSPGFGMHPTELARLVGPPVAREMLDLADQGMEILAERINEYDIDCDLHRGGVVKLSERPSDDTAGADTTSALNAVFGTRLQWLSGPTVRQIFRSPKFHHGTLEPRAFVIDPLRLTIGLAATAERLGVTIYDYSPAVGLVKSSSDTVAYAEVEMSTGRQGQDQHRGLS